MQATLFILYATAAVAGGASIMSAAYDRFHKPLATSFALLAGLLPWVFFLMWENLLPDSTALSVVAMFGSGPVFLVAFYLYGIGQRLPRHGIAAGASMIGMFAGALFSLVLIHLLSRMP